MITACTKGLYAKDTSAPYFRETVFDSCISKGADVGSRAEPDLGTVADAGNNSFYSPGSCAAYKHVKVAVRYPGVGDVMAEDNWWGCYPPSFTCFDGAVDYSPALSSDPNANMPSQQRQAVLRFQAALWQNSPNPFFHTTFITYQVPNPGTHVSLRIFDVTGRLVKTLVDEKQTPGPREVSWNGLNNDGRIMPSGVYLYNVKIGDDFEATKKMTLAR